MNPPELEGWAIFLCWNPEAMPPDTEAEAWDERVVAALLEQGQQSAENTVYCHVPAGPDLRDGPAVFIFGDAPEDGSPNTLVCHYAARVEWVSMDIDPGPFAGKTLSIPRFPQEPIEPAEPPNPP